MSFTQCNYIPKRNFHVTNVRCFDKMLFSSWYCFNLPDRLFQSFFFFTRAITIVAAIRNTKSTSAAIYDAAAGGSESALHNFPRIEVALAILSSSPAI